MSGVDEYERSDSKKRVEQMVDKDVCRLKEDIKWIKLNDDQITDEIVPVWVNVLLTINTPPHPNHFFVTLEENAAKLINLHKKMNQFYLEAEHMKEYTMTEEEAVVGTVCTVVVESTKPQPKLYGKVSFYRGIIYEVVTPKVNAQAGQKPCYMVFFIDCGYYQKIPLNHILLLKREYAHLEAQTICCTLCGVKPKAGVSLEHIQDMFHTRGRSVFAVFLNCLGVDDTVPLQLPVSRYTVEITFLDYVSRDETILSELLLDKHLVVPAEHVHSQHSFDASSQNDSNILTNVEEKRGSCEIMQAEDNMMKCSPGKEEITHLMCIDLKLELELARSQLNQVQFQKVVHSLKECVRIQKAHYYPIINKPNHDTFIYDRYESLVAQEKFLEEFS